MGAVVGGSSGGSSKLDISEPTILSNSSELATNATIDRQKLTRSYTFSHYELFRSALLGSACYVGTWS